MINTVVKSNGEVVAFDPDKINKWAEWAANTNVKWSDIALSAVKKLSDGCPTKDVHKALISACTDKEDPAHLKMAGRLLLGQIYKEAHGGWGDIPTLSEFYYKMVGQGFWETMDYDDNDLDYLEDIIDHSKDFDYGYTELRQIKDKYAVSNKITQQCFESPQFIFMGMAMKIMECQPEDRRLDDIVKIYHYLKDQKINAPTPYLGGLRTGFKGYASCCLVTSNDTADSIGVAEHLAYKMTVMGAGMGLNLKTRSAGDPVKSGQIIHQGKLPYYKCIDAAVKANRQHSRGGSATVSFSCLDPEILDLLKLKNPTTPEQKRISFMDYSFGTNKYFAEKVAKNEDWMLVSMFFAPKLHDLFYSGDIESFKVEYNRVLEDVSIPKKMISARELCLEALTQGVETGRIYLTWYDEANRHTPFNEPIYESNLCQEILLPQKGFDGMRQLYSEDGLLKNADGSTPEVALCFIAAIVAGRVSEEEYEDVAYYTTLMIDNVMDLMEYPFKQMEITAKARRSIGVGITNLAYHMAKNRKSYTSKEGKQFIHEHAEMHSYYLHKASLRLAKEKGVAEWIGKTKYVDGWTPVQTYNKNVDTIADFELKYDWDTLSKEIKANGGIRHSVLESTMPAESSSQASNTTNSVYPARRLIISKKSGNNKNIFIVPEYENPMVRYNYELVWDIPNSDLIDMYAIIQKFHGQSISSDLYLDYSKLPNGKVSNKQLLQEYLQMTKLGMKTRYYINSKSGVVDEQNTQEKGCAGGACAL